MTQADATITLSVPPTMTAGYLVALPQSPPALDGRLGAAMSALPAPLDELAVQMHDRGLLTVESGSADEYPPLPIRFLEIFGAESAQLATAATAQGIIAVQAIDRPGWPPLGEWIARGVAATLGGALDGIVVDTFTPCVLDVAQALRSLPGEDGTIAMSRWAMVIHSPDENGSWFTTKGLGRFGLPELQTFGVPPHLAAPWGSVLSGIAGALLRTWVGALREADNATFVPVPSILAVTEEDVARAYATEGNGLGGEARVAMRLDPAAEPDDQTFLTVVPTEDFATSAGEFYAAVCANLFGATEGEIRYSKPTAAMDRAIADARAALPGARQRFLDDELPAGANLIVKHRLAARNRSEFVWSVVTAWADADLVQAMAMNDAELDPSVRIGRPLRIAADSIVDWGYWRDGEGVIEGGWTNRALGD